MILDNFERGDYYAIVLQASSSHRLLMVLYVKTNIEVRMPCLGVVLADASPLLGDAMRQWLQRTEDVELLGEARDGDGLVTMVSDLVPDIAIMNANSLGLQTPAIAQRIRAASPNTSIVTLVPSEHEVDVPSLLASGVTGILPEVLAPEELLQAIRVVQAGQLVIDSRIGHTLLRQVTHNMPRHRKIREVDELTERETGILRLAVTGMTNPQIASDVGISRFTVKTHLARIFAKLGVGSRTEAALVALKRGWVSLDDVWVAATGSSTTALQESPVVHGRSRGLPGSSPQTVVGKAPIGRDKAPTEEQSAEGQAGRIDPDYAVGGQTGRFLDDLDEGYCLAQDEKYVFVNRKMEDMLGYSRHELLGKSIAQTIPPPLRRPILQLHRRRLAGKQVPTHYNVTMVKKGGSMIGVRLSLKVIVYRGARAVSTVVSERKKLMGQDKILRWLAKSSG